MENNVTKASSATTESEQTTTSNICDGQHFLSDSTIQHGASPFVDDHSNIQTSSNRNSPTIPEGDNERKLASETENATSSSELHLEKRPILPFLFPSHASSELHLEKRPILPFLFPSHDSTFQAGASPFEDYGCSVEKPSDRNSSTYPEGDLEREQSFDTGTASLYDMNKLRQQFASFEKKHEDDSKLLMKIVGEQKDALANFERKFDKQDVVIAKLTEQKTILSEEVNKYKDKVLKLESDFHDKIQKLESDYKDKIQKLESDYNDKIQKLESDYNDKIQKLESDHNDKMQKLESDYQEKMDKQQSDYQEKMDKQQSDLHDMERLLEQKKDEIKKLKADKENKPLAQSCEPLVKSSSAHALTSSSVTSTCQDAENISVSGHTKNTKRESKVAIFWDYQTLQVFDNVQLPRVILNIKQHFEDKKLVKFMFYAEDTDIENIKDKRLFEHLHIDKPPLTKHSIRVTLKNDLAKQRSVENTTVVLITGSSELLEDIYGLQKYSRHVVLISKKEFPCNFHSFYHFEDFCRDEPDNEGTERSISQQNKCGLFWDIENCNFCLDEVSLSLFVEKIKEDFCKKVPGNACEITVGYAAIARDSEIFSKYPGLEMELHKRKIKVKYVSPGPEAADLKLFNKIRDFSKEHSKNGECVTVIIITGDMDFIKIMDEVRFQCDHRHQIVLISGDNIKISHLKKYSGVCHRSTDFKQFCSDCKNVAHRTKIHVTNLKSGQLQSIKGLDNCRVLWDKFPCAEIEFSNKEEAEKFRTDDKNSDLLMFYKEKNTKKVSKSIHFTNITDIDLKQKITDRFKCKIQQQNPSFAVVDFVDVKESQRCMESCKKLGLQMCYDDKNTKKFEVHVSSSSLCSADEKTRREVKNKLSEVFTKGRKSSFKSENDFNGDLKWDFRNPCATIMFETKEEAMRACDDQKAKDYVDPSGELKMFLVEV